MSPAPWSMLMTSTPKFPFRLLSVTDDATYLLFRSASLDNLAARYGYECRGRDRFGVRAEQYGGGTDRIVLEDWTPGIGWSAVLLEDLRGRLTRNEISDKLFAALRPLVQVQA